MSRYSIKKARQDRQVNLDKFLDEKTDEFYLVESGLKRLASKKRRMRDSDVPDLADRARRRVVYGDTSKEQFVSREIEKWKSAQPAIVAGRYRDDEWIKSNIQFQFISRLLKAEPNAFKELRSLLDSFAVAFGSPEGINISVLHKDCTALADAENLLIVYIQLNGFRDYSVSYRHEIGSYEDADFPNGLRVLFYFLFMSVGQCDEGTFANVRNSLTAVFYNQFEIHRRSDAPNTSGPPILTDEEKETLISEMFSKLISEHKDSEKMQEVISKIQQFLDLRSGEEHEKAIAFIKVHSGILLWAAKHSMEKEWIMVYAYSILKEMYESQVEAINELGVPDLRQSSLLTSNSNSEMDGWQPLLESRAECEKRFRENFEEKMRFYFQFWGDRLGLDRANAAVPTSSGRPVDPEMESVDWLIEWNRGETYTAIANTFNKSEAAVKAGIKTLKEYNLPVRRAKKGRVPNRTL